MNLTTVTEKGQATIPQELRELLGLKKGDKVMFERNKDGEVVLRKYQPLDIEWHQFMTELAKPEWDSASDDEAFNDL